MQHLILPTMQLPLFASQAKFNVGIVMKRVEFYEGRVTRGIEITSFEQIFKISNFD